MYLGMERKTHKQKTSEDEIWKSWKDGGRTISMYRDEYTLYLSWSRFLPYWDFPSTL